MLWIRVYLDVAPQRVRIPPKTCVCPHVVYTIVVWCVVGSNMKPRMCPATRMHMRNMLWIRVSLDVTPQRVCPQNLCVSRMLYTQVWWGVLLDQILKLRMCPATRMHMH
jgi:hypothetical protein